MDLKKSTGQNFIYNLVYQLLLILVPFITTPYISRILGADGIGKYSYAQSLVAYFVLLASLGANLYAQREIAQVQRQETLRTQKFMELMTLRLITVGVALSLFFVLIFPNSEDRHLYFLASLEIVAVVFDITWFFQGIEQFRSIVLCNGSIKLLSVFLILIFVKQKQDLYNYILIYCGSILLGNVSLWTQLPRYLSHRKLFCLHPFSHAIGILRLFFPQVAIQIYTVLDKTMLGLLRHSDFENGYYEQSQKIAKIPLSIITAFGVVMAPRIASLHGQGKNEIIQKLINRSFRFSLALSFPIVAGFFVISSRFVPLFLGRGYDPVINSLYFSVLLVPAIGLSNVTGMQYLVPTGKERFFTFSLVIGACINFFFNLYLIPKHGEKGAIIASVFAEYSICFLQLWMVRKEIALGSVFRMLPRYLFNSLVMLFLLLFMEKYLNISWTSVALLGLAGGCIYIGLLYIEKDPLLQQITWQE